MRCDARQAAPACQSDGTAKVVAVEIWHRPRDDRRRAATPKGTGRDLSREPPLPDYQKHFDRLFDLAKAGDWDGVRNYEVKGSNSYSKMVARYRQDLLAVHAASEAAP